MPIAQTRMAGVFSDGSWLYTRNLVPGIQVYREGLVREGETEFRRWDANRSKLAAYLKRGGTFWPFRRDSRILYLGAGTGTTVSHLSDISEAGTILAIEISPRAFRELLALSARRRNVLPILGDASKPETYRAHAGSVDVLYQDVAQRDQESIFLRNASVLGSGGAGFLMIKARSADVSAEPRRIYAATKDAVEAGGFEAIDMRTLDPYAKDHAALVVRKA